MESNLEELVEKTKRGDWDSYLKIFFAQKDALYRKAFYITKNHHDTDDVMEESIIKGFKAVKKIENPKKVYAYLARIVVNNCYDLLKRNKKTTPLLDEVVITEFTDSSSTEKLDLYSYLDKLEDEHRTVLILRFFEDMKIEDIALSLDIPEGTVKSRVYYGLKKLKSMIGGEYREM